MGKIMNLNCSFQLLNRDFEKIISRHLGRFPKEKFAEPSTLFEIKSKSNGALKFKISPELKDSLIKPTPTHFNPGSILYTENVKMMINTLLRKGEKLNAQYIVHRALMEVKLKCIEELKEI